MQIELFMQIFSLVGMVVGGAVYTVRVLYHITKVLVTMETDINYLKDDVKDHDERLKKGGL